LISTGSTEQRTWRYFGIWTLASAGLFARPLYELFRLALQDDTSSHILLIPIISAWLLYSERPVHEILRASVRWPAAAFIVASALAALFSWNCTSCTARDHLSAYVLSLILLMTGGFVLIFGSARAKASSFALSFLLLAVPIPEVPLDKLIYCLQVGSAHVAAVFFDLSGAPVLRDGLVFHLPNLSIEVAQECSGIRSSLALLILALLVAHFSFRSFWKKLLFIAAGLLMMLIKNGIRITTLTLLASYVDPGFLYGRLHREGGVVFFLISLALLLPLYWALRKGEEKSAVTGDSMLSPG